MREITQIGKENGSYFAHFFAEPKEEPQEIRLGLLEEGVPAGGLQAEYDGEVLEIRSIYVLESYRRRGGGAALLAKALEIAEELKASGVLAYFPPTEELTGLFEYTDFYVMPGETISCVSKEALLTSPVTKEKLSLEENPFIKPLSKLLGPEMRALKGQLRKSGMGERVLSDPEMEPALSFAAFDKEGEILGWLITGRKNSSMLVYDLETSAKAPQSLVLLVLSALLREIRGMDEIEELTFVADRDSVSSLVNRVAGEDQIKEEVRSFCAVKTIR